MKIHSLIFEVWMLGGSGFWFPLLLLDKVRSLVPIIDRHAGRGCQKMGEIAKQTQLQ
jgi:hypothetical protein